jgi:hypothetical protein
MSTGQVFLSHVERDERAASEIRILLETALSESRVMGREEAIAESNVVLLLCGDGAGDEPALREDVVRARESAIPIIPIVHGSQSLATLSFPFPEPVSTRRGLELHDQMFAIKLLLVVREALSGEQLAARGSAPRA